MQRELQSLAAMSAQAEQLRREAGIGPQEQLEPVDATRTPRVLPNNARLEMKLRINGMDVTMAANSVRGALVCLRGE